MYCYKYCYFYCQEHYQSKKNGDELSTQKWWVPLSFFNSESTTIESVPSQWLKAEVSTKIEDIAQKDSWVIFNVNMSGIHLRVTKIFY